jgi:ribosomal protein L37AE/L43A
MEMGMSKGFIPGSDIRHMFISIETDHPVNYRCRGCGRRVAVYRRYSHRPLCRACGGNMEVEAG